jgi:hypothetical protein
MREMGTLRKFDGYSEAGLGRAEKLLEFEAKEVIRTREWGLVCFT